MKDDSGSYAVFTVQGSSASQMTAAKIMDIISTLPGCAGQAAFAVSAFFPGKNGSCPKILKIPKSECKWIRLPRHKWPISWSSMEDLVIAGTETLPCSENLPISSWSYDMEGHAKKCVDRYCELANGTTQQLYKVSTPCIDDHHFKEEETKSFGNLSQVCSRIVLKCVCLARIGRLDILLSENKLARSITKLTKACDKRLNRLISYIHHTSEYKQYCHVGNTAKQCRLGLFQDSDFAEDLEDSKSTSGGTMCIFGSHTFVPISWMCKKQTAGSHSSTESVIISLDTGLRLDCLPALELWDLIVAVLHGNTYQSNQER